MKRFIALLVAFAFVLGLGIAANAATAKKVVAKKVVAKKVVAKKVVAKKKVAKKAVKAAPRIVPVAPAPPPPPPVAPVPPAPVAVKAAAPAGLFGMGIDTALTGSYINTGKGQLSGSVGLSGDWVMSDFIGLGPMVGLSANSVKFTAGLGGFYGGGGLKAIPVRAGGIIMLPDMGGMLTYLSGGLNYVVYGNSTTSGNIGGDANIGIMADLGLGLGKTGFQIGYSVVRSETVSSKGLSLSVCQPIVL